VCVHSCVFECVHSRVFECVFKCALKQCLEDADSCAKGIQAVPGQGSFRSAKAEL